MLNDTLHSLFLAQAIGLYLLIVGIIMISRAKYYQDLLSHIKVGNSTIVLAGSFGLIVGISVVLVHNIWIWESELVITLVGWALLIKSILWLSFPEKMVKYAIKLYSGMGYYIVSVLAMLGGILLMTHGFYLFGTW